MPTGAGQIVTEDDFTAIADAGDEKPIGRLVASGTQALADATPVAITFSTEEIDTHSFHSTSVNTSRVTPTVPGYYRITGTVFFEQMTTAVSISAHIRKNGSTALAAAGRMATSASFAQSSFTTCIVSLDGNLDYVELLGTQDSAGADNTNQSVQFSSVLEWEYLRGL